jgi:Gas vesicle synthesis protein GvpO
VVDAPVNHRTYPQPEPADQLPDATRVLRTVPEWFAELTGLPAPWVSSIRQDTQGGWTLRVEVEDHGECGPGRNRVPGSYEVTLDARGRLTGYHPVTRYVPAHQPHAA